MRLSREIVTRREKIVRAMFRAEPDRSIPSVNRELKEKDGRGMAPGRLYDLRAEVTGTPVEEKDPGMMAARVELRSAVRDLQRVMRAQGIVKVVVRPYDYPDVERGGDVRV